MGKECTLCRVISIRIAVFAVKDYSLGWAKCRSPKEINKLSMTCFAEYYYLITNTAMDNFVIMNIIVVHIIVASMNMIVD